ncbi:MAG: cupin domain-containing protein [Kiloniellales bacterium]
MTASTIRLLPQGDEQSGLQPTQYVDRANLLEGDPTEQGHNFFTNARGNVMAGVWECTPCKERIDSYPVDEMMTVLAGSVTVADADGNAQTFGPGDTFVIGKGFRGTWHITETLRKFYMIVEPEGGA